MLLHQTEVSLFYPELPDAMEGLTILHISDLHFRRWSSLETKLQQVIHQGSDLLLCTGDICYELQIGNPFYSSTQSHGHCRPGLTRHGLVFAPETEKAVEYFSRLIHSAPARLGCFIVQGNHDPDDVMSQLNTSDVKVLANEAVEINISDEAAINVCGVRSCRRDDIDIIKTLVQLAPGRFTIGLAHYPETAEALAAGSVDLILAGHTHGGQICTPDGNPILTHSRTGKKYIAGLQRIRNSWLYTNRGVNTSMLPIRIHCPPEVARITLHRGRFENNSMTITELQ